MRTLVTGGAGYIGGTVAALLLSQLAFAGESDKDPLHGIKYLVKKVLQVNNYYDVVVLAQDIEGHSVILHVSTNEIVRLGRRTYGVLTRVEDI